MTYDSQITFTLDTICPWTYLAKRRLSIALDIVRATNPPVTFNVIYKPYQLYPDAPQAGEDKYAWYLQSRYGGGSEERMAKYVKVMQAYGEPLGIHFKFTGTLGNTLHAHRVIQYFQEEKGGEVAEKIVNSLYRKYFEEEQAPASQETLIAACEEAGIGKEDAKKVVEDEDEGLMETKMALREQTGNGIDSVPYVVFEGKRRDFTLEGAKEVQEYVTVLDQVIKESQ